MLQSFEGIPQDLPDSQNVLTLMHTSASTSNRQEKFLNERGSFDCLFLCALPNIKLSFCLRSANILHVWCTKCEKGASEGCVDEGHKVTSIKSTFFQQALKALPQLQCQLDIGYIFKLFDKLDEVFTFSYFKCFCQKFELYFTTGFTYWWFLLGKPSWSQANHGRENDSCWCLTNRRKS